MSGTTVFLIEFVVFRLNASFTGRNTRKQHENGADSLSYTGREMLEGKESGHGELLDESTCPVMDLIFDPELNCYFHPITFKYYQVA